MIDVLIKFASGRRSRAVLRQNAVSRGGTRCFTAVVMPEKPTDLEAIPKFLATREADRCRDKCDMRTRAKLFLGGAARIRNTLENKEASIP